MSYIAVSGLRVNPNPGSIYLAFDLVSSGGTSTSAEAFLDDDVTISEIHEAVAEAAREACRANSENVDAGARVNIFGGAVQVEA